MAVGATIAQMKVRDTWIDISVEDALHRFDSSRTKRCLECHGQVRAHAEGSNGNPAHFEHLQAHAGCSKSMAFGGVASMHPKPLS